MYHYRGLWHLLWVVDSHLWQIYISVISHNETKKIAALPTVSPRQYTNNRMVVVGGSEWSSVTWCILFIQHFWVTFNVMVHFTHFWIVSSCVMSWTNILFEPEYRNSQNYRNIVWWCQTLFLRSRVNFHAKMKHAVIQLTEVILFGNK